MRYFAIIGILCAFASSAFTQAADPAAIDLSYKLKGIDSSGPGYTLNLNHTVGLQNADPFEDIMLGYFEDTIPNNSALRFGGPLLFNTSNLPHVSDDYIVSYHDMNGDSINDIITGVGGGGRLRFHKGRNSYPYLDSLPDGQLMFYSYVYSMSFLGTLDYNHDGIEDVLVYVSDYLGSAPPKFLVYAGGNNFDKALINPEDSLPYPLATYRGYGELVAKFGKNLPTMLLISQADTGSGKTIFKTGLIRIHPPLSQDTVEWFTRSDRDSNALSPRNMYAMDITGDGVPDLLALDGTSIYIFKGGDDFGSYPLTKDHAYYVIHSPKEIDINFPLLSGFGGYMYNCGDLTGSGIPYLMVTASESLMTSAHKYAFFYAGGKALDSKFDAFLQEYGRDSYFTVDTLHTIVDFGRTAAVFQSDVDAGASFDELIYQDCDKIPHTPNPDLRIANISIETSTLSAIAYPQIAKNFVKIRISGIGGFSHVRIYLYDILGRLLANREVIASEGENTEYFDLTNYQSGSYVVKIVSQDGIANTHFIVRK